MQRKTTVSTTRLVQRREAEHGDHPSPCARKPGRRHPKGSRFFYILMQIAYIITQLILKGSLLKP